MRGLAFFLLDGTQHYLVGISCSWPVAMLSRTSVVTCARGSIAPVLEDVINYSPRRLLQS